MGKKAGMAIHPESGFQESRAVRILEDKLEEGQRIRTFFKENDRTPNHDGFFEFVAPDGTPRKRFVVQIKKTSRLMPEEAGKDKGKYRYRLETAFLYYVWQRVTDEPAFYFIVDVDTKKIFFLHLSDALLNRMDFQGKRRVTWAFSEEDILEDVQIFWEKLEDILAETDNRKQGGQKDEKTFSMSPKSHASDLSEKGIEGVSVRKHLQDWAEAAYRGDIPESVAPELSKDILPLAVSEDGRRIAYTQMADHMNETSARIVQILGEGGTGKSSFLLCFAGWLNDKEAFRAIYIRLNKVNGMTQEETAAFLEREIALALNSPAEHVLWGINASEKTEYFILLDGFNEIRSDKKASVAGQIRQLMEKTPVRIVVTSRQKITGKFHLYGIPCLYMEQLETRQVEDYLRKNGLPAEAAADNDGLLHRPMMLTVYADTNRESRLHRDVEFFSFFGKCKNRSELILDHMESLAAKYFMQVTDGQDVEKQIGQMLYIEHFLLPGIGWEMERQHLFQIPETVLIRYVEKYLRKTKGTGREAFKRWLIGRGIGEGDRVLTLSMAQVMDYLRAFPTVFAGGSQWAFTHQDYRDVLAAMYVIRSCGEDGDAVYSLLDQALSRDMTESIGELLTSLHPEGTETADGWLERNMDRFRYQPGDKIRMPLHNILRIWLCLKGNLAGADFHGLDLKGQILEPYIDSKGKRTDFTDAVIYPETLLPVGHKSRVTKICYSPVGRFLATASDDGCVCLWDSQTGQLERRFFVENDSFMSGLAFSPDGQFLAAASFDSVEIWELGQTWGHWVFPDSKGEPIGGNGIITDICWHPYRKELVCGMQESGQAVVWDIRTGRCRLCLHPDDKSVSKNAYVIDHLNVCRYSPQGDQIAAGFSNGMTVIWDSRSGRQILAMKTHRPVVTGISVRDICFLSDERLLTAGEDGILALWNLQNGEQIRRFFGHEKWIYRISLHSGGRLAATASGDHTVRIWDLETGECPHVFQHRSGVQTAVFQPEGHLLVSGTNDGEIGI